MSTAAQIGFYDHVSLSQRPLALVNISLNGHPTGQNGFVAKLVEMCLARLREQNVFAPRTLAAYCVCELITKASCGTIEVTSELSKAARFYYAVTPEGVYTFDARGFLEDGQLNNLGDETFMFFTSWSNDEERRKIEKEVEDLQKKLEKLRLRHESLRRRGF